MLLVKPLLPQPRHCPPLPLKAAHRVPRGPNKTTVSPSRQYPLHHHESCSGQQLANDSASPKPTGHHASYPCLPWSLLESQASPLAQGFTSHRPLQHLQLNPISHPSLTSPTLPLSWKSQSVVRKIPQIFSLVYEHALCLFTVTQTAVSPEDVASPDALPSVAFFRHVPLLLGQEVGKVFSQLFTVASKSLLPQRYQLLLTGYQTKPTAPYGSHLQHPRPILFFNDDFSTGLIPLPSLRHP